MITTNESIDHIFSLYDEQDLFCNVDENRISRDLQSIIPPEMYIKVEPLINELRDTDQRNAFIVGFKAGIKFYNDCVNFEVRMD